MLVATKTERWADCWAKARFATAIASPSGHLELFTKSAMENSSKLSPWHHSYIWDYRTSPEIWLVSSTTVWNGACSSGWGGAIASCTASCLIILRGCQDLRLLEEVGDLAGLSHSTRSVIQCPQSGLLLPGKVRVRD
jgi:hypothetical protein